MAYAGVSIRVFRTLTESDRLTTPHIKYDHISQYIVHQQAADEDVNANFSAIKKGQIKVAKPVFSSPHTSFPGKLMAPDSVMAVSFGAPAGTSSAENVSFFLTGIVAAHMRKCVAYNSKIVIHSKMGEVLNSDCDCPAGKGPHATCKHVVAIPLVLEKFAGSDELNVEKSCTDVLQTFRKPAKIHPGSPVKAEQLGKEILIRGRGISEDNPTIWMKFTTRQLTSLIFIFQVFIEL